MNSLKIPKAEEVWFSQFSEKSGKCKLLRNSQNYVFLSDRKIAELLDNSELQRKYENSDNSELYSYLSGPLSENSVSLEYSENGLPHEKELITNVISSISRHLL